MGKRHNRNFARLQAMADAEERAERNNGVTVQMHIPPSVDTEEVVDVLTESRRDIVAAAPTRDEHERKPARRVLDKAMGMPWAITPDALETILTIAARDNLPLEVIEKEVGRKLEKSETTHVRDGIASVPVVGPLFRYADLFTRISGATSYESVARDVSAAVSDNTVRAVILQVDSPGGELNGVSELADLIAAFRGEKPLIAHVSGAGASGAYWLASAADEIVINETAILGSLGVVIAFTDTKKRDAMEGIEEIEIVSSQSPKKRIDPATKDGRAEVQTLVDDLADVFIAKVAEYRGVSVDTVLADYGQGGVMVGQKALDAGLADRMLTEEALRAELVQSSRSSAVFQAASPTGEGTMPEETTLTAAQIAERYPEFVAAWKAEGATAERTRLAAIDALAEAGHEALIAACKADADCTPESAAYKIKMAEKAAKDARLEALKTDEAALDAPDVVSDSADDDAGAEARRVLAIHHRAKGQNSQDDRRSA